LISIRDDVDHPRYPLRLVELELIDRRVAWSIVASGRQGPGRQETRYIRPHRYPDVEHRY
jgi:hypothetical protein